MKQPRNKSQWYFWGDSPEQRNFYKFFIKDRKVSAETLIECMDEFLKEQGTFNNLSCSQKRVFAKPGRKKKYALEIVQIWFSEFLQIVSAKTGLVFKKNPKKSYDYDDWYEEASMDGSLAYNGVTDDF